MYFKVVIELKFIHQIAVSPIQLESSTHLYLKRIISELFTMCNLLIWVIRARSRKNRRVSVPIRSPAFSFSRHLFGQCFYFSDMSINSVSTRDLKVIFQSYSN